MALNLTQYKLTSKYGAAAYLAGLQELLPTGNIWLFSVGAALLASSILYDRIFGTGFSTLQDSTTAADTMQDTISSTDPKDFTSSLWGNILSCFASELARLRADIVTLQNEAVPGLSDSLLTDWERVLGLPGDCFTIGATQTKEERQEAAHLKYYDTFKTITAAYLVEIAAGLGFTVTINELEIAGNSFRLGAVRMGGNRMGGAGSYAVLTVTVEPGYTGDLAQLQCVFLKLKPAHTVIVWVLP